MQDSPLKGAGMRDQDPPFQTLFIGMRDMAYVHYRLGISAAGVKSASIGFDPGWNIVLTFSL